jgi:hypothetical protein
MSATEVAEAQWELLRIRAVRADLMAKVNLASSAWRRLTATKGSLIANDAGHRATFEGCSSIALFCQSEPSSALSQAPRRNPKFSAK